MIRDKALSKYAKFSDHSAWLVFWASGGEKKSLGVKSKYHIYIHTLID